MKTIPDIDSPLPSMSGREYKQILSALGIKHRQLEIYRDNFTQSYLYHAVFFEQDVAAKHIRKLYNYVIDLEHGFKGRDSDFRIAWAKVCKANKKSVEDTYLIQNDNLKKVVGEMKTRP